MQMSFGFILRRSIKLLLLASCLVMVNANAQGGGGGGGEGGGGAYAKLEPFTVNLVGLNQVIQVSVTLKLAKPEAGEKVKLYMPVVRNTMILLLSGKTAEQMQSLEGKQQLIKESKVAINKAVELNAKEGVSDVLFEQIIIQ